MMNVFQLFALLMTLARVSSDGVPHGSVIMRIVNNAGMPIELFWVNVFEDARPLVKQTTKPIRNSTDTVINSYDTHSFVVKFLNPIDGKDPQATFNKGPKEEVITVSYTPEGGMTVTQVTKFDELLLKVKKQTAECGNLTGEKYDHCVATGIAEDVIQMEDKKVHMTKYRDLMSGRLRNYTCSDETMETSKPLRSLHMTLDNKRYQMDILFDTPSAKIWVMHNFITEEECKILETHGKPRLTRATVAGEDGMSVVSENRKAQQASYNMHQNHGDDPLSGLDLRIRTVTNRHAGYNLQAPGQEDFTIIQYNKDDQYTPHCDGSCDGTDHKAGGRVATAVMYCRTATKGGGTTFTKADVFVKPTNGMATFFSYKGLDGKMEDGYTEHSGCPVLEGEKWITTAWMREGVTKEDPWHSFDPSGVKIEGYSTSLDEEAQTTSQSSESENTESQETDSVEMDSVETDSLETDSVETEYDESESEETESENPNIEITETKVTNMKNTESDTVEAQIPGIISEPEIEKKNDFLGNVFNSWTSGFTKRFASKNDL